MNNDTLTKAVSPLDEMEQFENSSLRYIQTLSTLRNIINERLEAYACNNGSEIAEAALTEAFGRHVGCNADWADPTWYIGNNLYFFDDGDVTLSEAHYNEEAGEWDIEDIRAFEVETVEGLTSLLLEIEYYKEKRDRERNQ